MTWTIDVQGRPRGGSEALVRRFEQGGLAEIAEIGGPWAMVARDHTRCLVAVDAFGGVPLYVDAAGPVDLHQHRGPLEVRAVEQHLDALIVDPRLTWFQGVYRVPAGWGGPPRALHRIWRPTPFWVHDPAAQLRAALAASVEHLRGADPVNIALSGGLDSSVIASFFPGADALQNAFPGWGCDESAFARAVADQHQLRLRPIDARTLGPEQLEQVFEPPVFPAMFVNHYLNLSLLEAAEGSLWTGFGGDEVIGHGASALQEWGSAGAYGRLWGEAMLLAVRDRTRPASLRERAGRWVRAGLHGSFRSHRGRSPRERRFLGMTHAFLQISRYEQRRMADRAGVRLVQPFLDAELAALCLSIPDTARVHHGRTRAVLRSAFKQELPTVVRRRCDKADLRRSFDVNGGAWLPRAWSTITSGVLNPWRSLDQLQIQRAAFEAGDHLAGAALWRAYGAARWISWHTAQGSCA